MTVGLVSTVGHGSSDLWYLTRAAGLVSLVLLSATLVLGLVASVGWTTERWPRFLSQSVHRNLSLYCLAFIGLHIVSTVADGYVPISIVDAVIPFRSPYRPMYVGFGALAFDMLLAVAITSGLRRRIGTSAWRAVHWLAYVCWPIAVVHGLGSGSDSRLPGALVVFVACIGSVAATVTWRVAVGRAPSTSWRLLGGVAALLVVLGISVFAVAGPLRAGWSHRSGTSPKLLAQLAGSAAPTSSHTASSGTPSAPAPASGLPSIPFNTTVTGSVSTTGPNANGDSTVLLSMRLADTATPLTVRITGPASDGGVSMRTSAVGFGPLSGQVTALQGSVVAATVRGAPGPVNLTLQLSLDPASGTLTGQAAGSAP
jgi:DMSO/TMAO reductase YedYZ heme-binding membrane subunit